LASIRNSSINVLRSICTCLGYGLFWRRHALPCNPRPCCLQNSCQPTAARVWISLYVCFDGSDLDLFSPITVYNRFECSACVRAAVSIASTWPDVRTDDGRYAYQHPQLSCDEQQHVQTTAVRFQQVPEIKLILWSRIWGFHDGEYEDLVTAILPFMCRQVSSYALHKPEIIGKRFTTRLLSLLRSATTFNSLSTRGSLSRAINYDNLLKR
jgi:hypothetical protein